MLNHHDQDHQQFYRLLSCEARGRIIMQNVISKNKCSLIEMATDIAYIIPATSVQFHQEYLNIVRGALAIGRQADPIETETIIARADKIRKNVSESVA